MNNRLLYQRLILDQGYWEDSHLTPPSEEALIEDLEKMRESGLPNLWIPRADCFFEVDAIPMLGNGKKDLKKIQATAKKLSEDVF